MLRVCELGVQHVSCSLGFILEDSDSVPFVCRVFYPVFVGRYVLLSYRTVLEDGHLGSSAALREADVIAVEAKELVAWFLDRKVVVGHDSFDET